MGKKLVIVESPAKAKTIGRYLGKDYVIAASVGHIRDLPASTLGVNVDDSFKPVYITMRGKEKVIKELKDLNNDTEFTFIATDPDREGEAIAWHIATILKIDPSTVCRITFNEITSKAVKEAIESPRTIDMDLVNAQQARRILDRIVGYELSPLLWNKIRKGLSAGRVQSVATKLVLDRDELIEKFIPEEYWNISAIVNPQNKEEEKFTVKYIGTLIDGKIEKKKVVSKDQADEIISKVSNNSFEIISLKKGNKEKSPPPPFTTSTLQQEASRRLGFSSKRTMSIAQKLYEGINIQGMGQTALVSYIRTDSVRISDEAIEASRAIISDKLGAEYVATFVRKYKNKNQAQDAHEAIRPTHFDLSPEKLIESLTSEQFKLYKLIWDRFLSTQMASCKLNTISLDAVANGEVFHQAGETIIFPGFMKLFSEYQEDNKGDEELKEKIPQVNEGDILSNNKILSEQKFTTPPAHYNEASLIKAMEENGIGRPSTYAPTISVILEREYVEKQGKALLITPLGKLVTSMLNENFSYIVDVSFTAGMESKLDEIESGDKKWVDVLSDFYPSFHNDIKSATSAIEKVKIEEEKLNEKCPDCESGELVIKEGKFGRFIACSTYPTCKYTRNIEVQAKGSCPICGSGLLVHKSKKYKGKSFFTCDKKGSNKDCDFISWDLPIENRKCEVCGSYMVLKRFRGKAYPKCADKSCSSNQRKKKDDNGEEEQTS